MKKIFLKQKNLMFDCLKTRSDNGLKKEVGSYLLYFSFRLRIKM